MLKIHYGPNGTYKTSGALQDDVIPELLKKATFDKQGNMVAPAGRYVITNIRGFTLDSFLKVYPDAPETSEILNLNLDSAGDLDRMRTVLFWAPVGALIVFDEAQLVFPKQWRDKYLDQYVPVENNGVWSVCDQPFTKHPEPLCNPLNWIDSWTRHRHWNFDVILTSQSLKLIREDIRCVAEQAYCHTNLAVIGIKGRYKECQHNPSEARSKSTISTTKKIKQDTFKTYASTATGITTDTKAGQSLFKSPPVLLAILCVVSAIGYGIFNSTRGPDRSSPVDKISQNVVAVDKKNIRPDLNQINSNDNNLTSGQQSSSPALIHPFSGYVITLKAYMRGKGQTLALFNFNNQDTGSYLQQTLLDVVKVGYRVEFKNQCFANFFHNDKLVATAKCNTTQIRRRVARI